MRSISAELSEMLASRHLTRARCLWVQSMDGTQLGFTDIDIDLRIDIGEGEILYRAGKGVLGSDIEQVAGLEPDNMEITGPISTIIPRAAVLGGAFSHCRAKVFDVSWANLDAGIIPLMGGRIADTRVEGNRFVFEMRSHQDRYNQSIGSVLAPYCVYDFGDSKCTKTRIEYPAVITGTASGYGQFMFSVNLAGVHSDNFFNLGTVQFTSGQDAPLEEIEIFDYEGASGVIELLAPVPYAPAVGDTVILRQGCSKLKSSTDPAVLTCLSWENVINFGGEDQVPGTERYMRFSALQDA